LNSFESAWQERRPDGMTAVENDFKSQGPDARLIEDHALESRRSASKALFCERCQAPLTGKKDRWCSDACRMADRRQRQAARLRDLITIIETSVAALRSELEGDL
jgi:predicted nucleic acid-binding Zn ribbon protein